MRNLHIDFILVLLLAALAASITQSAFAAPAAQDIATQHAPVEALPSAMPGDALDAPACVAPESAHTIAADVTAIAVPTQSAAPAAKTAPVRQSQAVSADSKADLAKITASIDDMLKYLDNETLPELAE